ncbi:MAG TPA: UDP-N-acetylmuramate dehydrogenase [Bacteroidota bacterium]|nr:UDP-N-acetylmuramate dehydrogenase [Bacteroidota bacterium]
MIHPEDIQKILKGRIALNEPMSRYTSVRIGGPADFLLEPADREDALRLLSHFQEGGIPFTVIGKGSNLLVSDEGIRGIVVHLEPGLNSVAMDAGMVNAGAGIPMARFVDFCVQQGLSGVEMLAGIPGTLGGGVVMNAGAYGGEISNYLVDVEVMRNARPARIPKEQIGFSYRHASLEGAVVLGARFRLPAGDRAELMRVRRDLLIRRNRAQPVNMPNSGSMFKNPPGNHAAKLIDEAGLKGTKRGGAGISALHANFIVNHGGAKARDVVELLELAHATVMKRTGISMELEIRLVGFGENIYEEIYA